VVGATTLAIAGLAEGDDALALHGFTVDTGGGTTGASGARSLALGDLDLTGSFRVERSGSTWRLRISDGAVAVPGLATVTLEEFWVVSSGSFAAEAIVDQLGPDALSIRDASISLRRTAAGVTTLRVESGRLYLPVGEPVDLPTLSVGSDGTLSRSLTRTLGLGSALFVPSVPLTLTLDDDGLAVAQTAGRTFTLLGGTVTLSGFFASSEGAFSGTVTGAPEPLGFVVPGASFTLSKPTGSDTAELTLTSSPPVDLGLVSGTATGRVAGDGTFDFELTAAANFTHLGFGVTGEAAASLTGAGLSGAFTGTVCAGLCVDVVDAEIGNDGLLEGTIPVPGPNNDIPFSIPIFDPGDE
jgi:hypothetical protein